MDSEQDHIQQTEILAPATRTEPSDRAYRIYRVRVNGDSLGVVRESQLKDLLVSIKGLNLYRDSRSLNHGQTFETDIKVHGRPLHVWVQVHVWKVLRNGHPRHFE